MLCGHQGNKIIEVITTTKSPVDTQHVSLPVVGQPEACTLQPSFLETQNAFPVWGVRTLTRVLLVFFFPLHRAQCLFPSKSFFALGTPRRLMADRAAADLVLSLHLNKHSCPDWQKPRLCFQPCLHRQGRYCYRADADAISQMCSKRK